MLTKALVLTGGEADLLSHVLDARKITSTTSTITNNNITNNNKKRIKRKKKDNIPLFYYQRLQTTRPVL